MARVILFDVNGTLLDTGALDPWFERHFGDASARERWFTQLEVLFLVSIATGEYKDFSTLAEAAVQMRAERERVKLATAERQELREWLQALPAYPEVPAALRRLAGAGLRLAALTNGTLEGVRAQLEYAELRDYFEEVFSADDVERFKPAREPYTMAVARLDVRPKDARMVAAHAWDIAGAHSAGLKTGFVRRPGKVMNPLGPEPDLEGADLLQLAELIVDKDA